MSDPVPGDVPDELAELAAKVIYADECEATEDWEAPDWDELSGGDRAQWLTLAAHVLAAVLPVVRQQIAAENERNATFIREFAEAYLYDGDHDAPLPGYAALYDFAARVVRGDP